MDNSFECLLTTQCKFAHSLHTPRQKGLSHKFLSLSHSYNRMACIQNYHNHKHEYFYWAKAIHHYGLLQIIKSKDVRGRRASATRRKGEWCWVDWVSEYDVDKRAIWWISWTDHNHYKRCHTHSFTCFLIVCVCVCCAYLFRWHWKLWDYYMFFSRKFSGAATSFYGFSPIILLSPFLCLSFSCTMLLLSSLLTISNELLLFMSPLTHSFHFLLPLLTSHFVDDGFFSGITLQIYEHTNMEKHWKVYHYVQLSLCIMWVCLSVVGSFNKIYETHTHPKNLIALVVKLYTIKINLFPL